MRDSIADFEVLEPWPGTDRRYVCRPPERLGRAGRVLVSELAVDAESWQPLCDFLLRLAAAAVSGPEPGPPLLDVIEVGPDPQGGVFLVTEPAAPYAAGASGNPGPAHALEAAARAAHGLHEVGLAHGSIHPGTLLVTERGPVLDLPRLDAPAGQIVRVGPWPELVSLDPELLAGESPSRRSDIWALGATLHSILTPRPLFPGIDGDEPVTAVQRLMFTRPEPDPDLPASVRDLIGECLALDPADRPATALAVAERLARVEVDR